MPATPQVYNTQTPRIGKIKGHMMRHAEPEVVLSRHGRQVPMPLHQSDTYVARRWVAGYGAEATNFKTQNKFFQDDISHTNADNSARVNDRVALYTAGHQISEGVTPVDIKHLSANDVSVTIQQYGCLYGWSDKADLFYEDDIPSEMLKQAGERMALVNEMIVYGVLKGNSNVFYGGAGTGLSSVNGTLTLNMVRKMTKQTKNLHGKMTNEILSASPKFGTEAVEAGYFVFCHTDLEPVIRDLEGFVPTAKYGNGHGLPRELGKVENFRFICSPELVSRQDVGAAVSGTDLYSSASGGNAKADVYSFIVLAQDHFSQLAVRGARSMNPTVLPPNSPDKSDPLGQRGYIGLSWWKAAFIENEAWGVVGHVAVPKL